ncbi:MAG TPA: NAD(P)-dependent oxidoreductase [Caproiciproducens sp.]|nr:NAD(P)-dependent oxidoreductase [Caproiciproducens sp.]
MAVHVVNEAKRCLNCKVPQCRNGCPISTPIPQMIQAFLGGRIDDAGLMLFENNPLSIICSLVCDHEKQCEGHCVLGHKGNPVNISSIEHYISDNYLDKVKLETESRKHKKAAIIGSGPAGITISILLAQRGYGITLFDSRDKIGGVLRYGIPEFRLPKRILSRYKNELLSLGVKIRPNTTIGGALSIDDLFRDGYKSVFIGTGVWRPNALNIPGESLGNVHFAIDYLCNPDSYDLGQNVAVIGAGNTAMDVARTVLRKGAKHVTVYARSKTATASAAEFEYAKMDGVRFVYGKIACRITDEGPCFKDVIFHEDESIEISEENEKLYPADSTIISIGQGPKNKIVSTTTGIEVNERGLLVTDRFGTTTRTGIYACGDVVNGAKTVVEAVKYAKSVADAMDDYMKKL